MRHRVGLSRNHGQIIAREGVGFFLEPLRREGFPTCVNGAPLPPNAVPVLLCDGDVISFGGAPVCRAAGDRLKPWTILTPRPLSMGERSGRVPSTAADSPDLLRY